MSNKIEYLKTVKVLDEVNKRIKDLRGLLYIREDSRVRNEFEILLSKRNRLNKHLLAIQNLIEGEAI